MSQKTGLSRAAIYTYVARNPSLVASVPAGSRGWRHRVLS